MTHQSYPNFKSREFLNTHIKHTMAFYHPHCIDAENGGYFQHFKDDGSIYDEDTRHLVSSTRFVFNYAMAASRLDNSDSLKQEYLTATQHGIEYLRQKHRNLETGGYAWLINGSDVLDASNHCYGLGFVVLAYAMAMKAGLSGMETYIEETFDLMEKHFWSEEDGLYRDEISGDWQQVSSYRGQNANMHSCEAMIAAYEATQNEKYLIRAVKLADNICNRQASLADGKIWEHYKSDWSVDWDYNKSDPQNLFRPWGFQPGHLTEWTKLLLILDRYCDERWLVPRAFELFDEALEKAWDKKNGGICYGFAPDGDICDGDKYFWVQAESLAAAALLAERSGQERYWDWYHKIWAYCWDHLIDHQYGAWYRILDQQNNKYDDLKSPAGKTDYHTMGACYEVLNLSTLDR